MPDWKDTVMTMSAIESLFIKTRPSKPVDPSDHQIFMNMLHNLCVIQAKISSKAGANEVVKWITEHAFIRYDGVHTDLEFSKSNWQARLKEWGYE